MYKKHLTLILLLIIAALSTSLLFVILRESKDNAARERDIIRLTDLYQIRQALAEYKETYGSYPACLYKNDGCKALEGSSAMPGVPTDPLTNIGYTYAAIGSGAYCTSYHLGVSLERTKSQSLLTGSDTPPHADEDLCKGSDKDFSGFSYAPGGQKCNLLPGIPQPTDSPKGESCHDLKP